MGKYYADALQAGHGDALLSLRRVHGNEEAAAYDREQRHRAARNLAGTFAIDADDCAMLLEMLGLTAGEGKRCG